MMVKLVLSAAAGKDAGTEFIRVSESHILPCDACWTCKEIGACHIDDDMQMMYPKLLKADGIIIGSPVHMGHSVSGHAQIFLDRTFVFWHEKRLKNKIGGGVVVSNRRGGISTMRIINDIFIDHQILIAGYATGYGFAPGDIRKDDRALTEAENLGKRLRELIKLR